MKIIKKNVLFELYDKSQLTSGRLNFIVENCMKYMNITSSFLVKRLIKEDNFKLFSIIFENLNFFDYEFIVNTSLFYYKNKPPISTSDLK